MSTRSAFIAALIFVAVVTTSNAFVAPQNIAETVNNVFGVFRLPLLNNDNEDKNSARETITEATNIRGIFFPVSLVKKITESFGKIFSAPFGSGAVCPVSGASPLGGPFVGTHQDGRGGWQSENGADYGAPGGTPVLAIVDGTICDRVGQVSPICEKGGNRLYLCGSDGNKYYYAHLENIEVGLGDQVNAGEQIASVAGACSPSHLHIAIQDESQLGAFDAFYNSCTGGGGGEGSGDDISDESSENHTVCQDKKCVSVPGKGINQCDGTSECKTSHTTCLGTQCIIVPEPGKDECGLGNNNLKGFSGKCPLATHNECINLGIGPQCAVVPGPGANECKFNSECLGTSPPGSGSCKIDAQTILNSPNADLNATSTTCGASAADPRPEFEQLASRDDCKIQAAQEGCFPLHEVTANLDIIEGLAALSFQCSFRITAFGGGDHSSNSNHYNGNAVDIGIPSGCSASQMRAAFCGRGLHVNDESESNHWHVGTDSFNDIC